MRTSQDLLDVERRIRITSRTRERWINDPARGPTTVGIFDDLLAMLEARRLKIKEEIGALPDLPAPVYEPAPTDVSGWEDFK